MTCKDCVHYELCFDYTHLKHSKSLPDNREDVCEHFKNKANFIELPCKVGTELFLSDYLNVHHRLKEYKFCGDRIVIIIECWEWQRTCTRFLEEFGKTVFLTKEEAEQKLKGGADNE
jgi:hypothetical protein